MFGKLKEMFGGQKAGINVFSPLDGELVPLAEVNDPTFSEAMLGDGVAIKPTGNKVLAPADGELAVMFPTGHAASVVSNDGVEILIHVGLDTVKLKGEHFIVHAKQGDKVKKGDLLLEFDAAAIAAAGYDIVTPIIITNGSDFSRLEKHSPGPVKALDEIISLQK